MTLLFIAKLGLRSGHNNVTMQKIDGLSLETYDIVLASFLLYGSLNKVWFIEKSFLLAKTSIKVI